MDGTGNEIGDGQSNVVKLYRTLAEDDTQSLHYIMGVGTNDSPSLLTRPFNKLKGVLGLAFGLGLEDDVLDAYRWLSRSYTSAESRRRAWRAEQKRKQQAFEAENPGAEFPKEEPPEFVNDQIYITGFSRGAYAARVLAGFINNFGLVSERELHLIAPVFRSYRGLTYRDRANETDSIRFKALRFYDQALRPDHPPIRALLLFDTVASMIRLDWPWYTLKKYWSLADLGLHVDVDANPSVRIVVQALAINERRTFFRPLRWREGLPYHGNNFRHDATKRRQYVRQRWFAGFHSDIGGSPDEDEAGIGKITALWVLRALREEETQANAEDLEKANERRVKDGLDPVADIAAPTPGLRFRRFNKKLFFFGKKSGTGKVLNPAGKRYSGPDPYAKLHNSVFGKGFWPRWSWVWLLLELLPPKAWIRRAGGKIAPIRFLWPYYLPLLEPRYIPETHEIDDSVFIRARDKGYAPPNLTRDPPATLTRWWDEELE